MKLKEIASRFVRYIFTLVIFIGLACSSDDNVVDEDNLINGNSSFTVNLDNEQWSADMVYITTTGGPDFWEEDDDRFYFVTISAIKFLGDFEDSENAEFFNITFIVPEHKFSDPKGTYLAPPPETSDEAGYSVGHYATTTDNISFISIDPLDDSRFVGKTNITGFEIGSQTLLGEGYVSLSGTFEYELFGWEANTGEFIKKEAKEGSFQITNQFF